MRGNSKKKFRSLEAWKSSKAKGLSIKARFRLKSKNTKSSCKNQEAERNLKENLWGNA